MKIRFVSAIVIGLALGAAACAQDASPAPPAGQSSAGGGYGRRGDRGMGMGMRRGVTGTVTEVAPDHFTVKSFMGETYTVHFSANTRIMKQVARARGEGGGRMRGDNGEAGGEGLGQNAGQDASQGMGQGAGDGMGGGNRRMYMRGGNPPQLIKASDIKVGDAIAAMGEIDSSAKSVGAVAIVQLDPERARQMQAMEENYGKTWLMGRVTAIDGVKVTLSGPDNTAHTFVADENTSFRERREPVTLADIHVGDMVRAEGAIENGAFTATTVNVMRMPQGGPAEVPRNAPPQ